MNNIEQRCSDILLGLHLGKQKKAIQPFFNLQNLIIKGVAFPATSLIL